MNKDFLSGFIAGIILLFLVLAFVLPAHSVSIIKSPGAENEIISLIDSAQETIHIEVYILTSNEILNALISAKQRGVDVKVILEKRVSDNTNEYAYTQLSNAGANVCWASQAYKLTHSKLIIVDGKKALVGSHNLSNSALKLNRELSLLIEGNIISQLLELFNSDWEACSLREF